MMSNFEKFGKYLLLEKLAAGGMAEVYLAKSAGANGVNKFVAIKRILPHLSTNQDFVEMFKQEAKVAVNLNHSNIVSIYEFGIEKGQFFIVMEFVEGRNLRQIINELKKSNRSVKIEEAIYIVKEAASGLDNAHRCVDQHTGRPLNITHRDMSPQNIMISFEGESKVIDFGIAKKTEDTKEETKAGTLKGKFAYMSPEQAEGDDVDPRTDIFALGIILWELLANDRLFTGSNENAILRKVRECQIPQIRKINPLVPQELERIVNKALAKDRNVRYQTAANMQKDLNRFLNTQYPDFSTQDFSKTIIECFKSAYLEGREKLIVYSKVDTPPATPNYEDSDTVTATIDEKNQVILDLPPVPNQQQHKLAEKNDDNDEVENRTLMTDVKVELDGIKDAMSKFGKGPTYQVLNTNRQARIFGEGTRHTQFSKVSQKSHVRKNQSSDIFAKFILLIALSFAGYFSYEKYYLPHQLLVQKNLNLNLNLKNILSKVQNQIQAQDSNQNLGQNSGQIPGQDQPQNPGQNSAADQTLNSGQSPAPVQGQFELSATASVKLSITSEPMGAQIFVDGQNTGRMTPAIITLTANKESIISLKKEFYFQYESIQNLQQTGSLVATLQPMPKAAYLNINVQNGGLNPVVFVNGQRLTEKPPIKRYTVSADTEIIVSAINPVTQFKDQVKVKVGANIEKNIDLILGRSQQNRNISNDFEK